MSGFTPPITPGALLTHLRKLDITNGWVRFEAVESVLHLTRGTLGSFYRHHQPSTRGRTRGHTVRSPCVLQQESTGIFADVGCGKLAIVRCGLASPAFVGGSREAPGVLKYSMAQDVVHPHAERDARAEAIATKEPEGPNEPGCSDGQGVDNPGEKGSPLPPRAVEDAGRAHDEHDNPAAMIDVDKGAVGRTPLDVHGEEDDEVHGGFLGPISQDPASRAPLFARDATMADVRYVDVPIYIRSARFRVYRVN